MQFAKKTSDRICEVAYMLTVIMLIYVDAGRISPPTHWVKNKQPMTSASRILLLFLLKRKFKVLPSEQWPPCRLHGHWLMCTNGTFYF